MGTTTRSRVEFCRTRLNFAWMAIAIGVALSVLTAQRVSASVPVTYNTIALSGETGNSMGLGPNLGLGVYFLGWDFSGPNSYFGFWDPVLNSAGQVAFGARLGGAGINENANDVGIWTHVGGTLAPVVRTGVSSPGPNISPGVYFDGLNPLPIMNSSGHLAFGGELTGTGADLINYDDIRGIWTNVGGSLSAVTLSGTDLALGPNLGPGVEFFYGPDTSFIPINDAGKVAFIASISGTTNNKGIWTNVGGSMSVVARSGAQGPGPNAGPGVTFSSFGDQYPYPVAINSAGEIAFLSSVTGAGVNSSNDTGVWTNVGGSMAPLAREGTGGPGPNLGPNIYFGDSIFGGFPFSEPSLNAAGQVAFSAVVSGTGVDSTNNSGVWTNVGGTLEPVARSGTDGPLGPHLGTGIEFIVVNLPVINSAGKIAFLGAGDFGPNYPGGYTPGNPGAYPNGIWTDAGGSLAAIAVTGTDGPLGPNLGAGVYFGNFYTQHQLTGDALTMNSAAQISFVGELTGTGVDYTNDRGVWVWADGELTKVVREGDLFDVDPSPLTQDLRTIEDFLFWRRSGGEDGRHMSLNDDGLLVLTLRFTDGSDGVFTAQVVPEPSSLALAGLGAVSAALLAQQRTRRSNR